MRLDSETFGKVRTLLASKNHPTVVVQYNGAEKCRDGDTIIPIVWFKCTDGRTFPKCGQLVAIDEQFRIRFTKPYVYCGSITRNGHTHSFRVACSKTGRTISR